MQFVVENFYALCGTVFACIVLDAARKALRPAKSASRQR